MVRRRDTVVLGRLWREIALAWNDHAGAEESLREALTIAQAIGNPPQLWKTHAALGQLHAVRNDREAARREYRAARAVIDSVVSGLRHATLRASLERAEMTWRIYEQAGQDA